MAHAGPHPVLPHPELAFLSGHCGTIGSIPRARAALKRRGSLQVWFDPATVWLTEPGDKRGRPATITGAAIQACLTLQAGFELPVPQITGWVASLAEMRRVINSPKDWPTPDWPTPDFCTSSPCQMGPNLAIPNRPGTGALRHLIDSAGIEAEASGSPGNTGLPSPGKGASCILASTRIRWKSGPWKSLAAASAMSGRQAPPVRVNRRLMLPELPARIPARLIGKVSADGTHDTRACHAAIAARWGSAVVPVRQNARPWQKTTPGRSGPERDSSCHQPPRLHDPAGLDRLLSTKPGRHKNTLLPVARRARHGR